MALLGQPIDERTDALALPLPHIGNYQEDDVPRLRTALDEQAISALQDFTHFLHRWRFIPRSFDVREWIDPRPLDSLLNAHTALAG